MTSNDVGAHVAAACDYLDAAVTGSPEFATLVASVIGPEKVSRGLASVLIFVVNDAAIKADCHPGAIVQRIRENYGGNDE